jgi:hypothetical protein
MPRGVGYRSGRKPKGGGGAKSKARREMKRRRVVSDQTRRKRMNRVVGGRGAGAPQNPDESAQSMRGGRGKSRGRF